MNTTWTDEYLVSSYEVDPMGKLPLQSLGKFLQETAYHHANHLEFGYSHLKEKGLFWVLSRLVIKMNRYPGWTDKIYIRTWPSGVESLLAYRDFQVLDAQENVIGKAGSAWLMLDSVRRRPQRMTLLKEKVHLFPDKEALKEKPEKLPNLSQPEAGPVFPVRYSDLDLYDHVNNARYMQWVLDNYPPEMHRKYEVSCFEINFLNESKLGDDISILTENVSDGDTEQEPLFLHSVLRQSDKRAVCLTRIRWKKR
jgi:acyl-ACP thioesterase